MLDAVVAYLPAPAGDPCADLAALVFKVHTDVDRAVAGDIVAVAGPKGARAGTTLSTRQRPVRLEAPRDGGGGAYG